MWRVSGLKTCAQIEGSIMHTRAHDEKQRERRGDTLVLRDLQVFSPTLGVSGKCDVVEFHADPDGVTLRGENGLWLPYPVEYKRGSPKSHDADRLQLCCQAMCLEEMLCCCVPEGSLFYGETRRRDVVEFTAELRGQGSQYAFRDASFGGAWVNAKGKAVQKLQCLLNKRYLPSGYA